MLNTLPPFHDPEDTAAIGPLALVSSGFFDPAQASFSVQKPIRYFVSSLFAARPAQGDLVRDLPLASPSRSKRYMYTGEPLDQFDLDILLHCTAAATGHRSRGVWMEHAQLIKALGKRNDATMRTRICHSLARLQGCSIAIEGQGYRYMTRLMNRALLDSAAGASLVEVNNDFADSIRSMRGLDLMLNERRGLGNDGLAKWLHGALWIFPAGFSSDFSTLSELSGLRHKSSYGFQKQCLDALELLIAKGVVTQYSTEQSGHLHVEGRRNNTHASACGFLSLARESDCDHQETTCATM
ncbi:MAG: hypothetical protein ACOCWR_02155 [Oceanidesulfovibrio sp.]